MKTTWLVCGVALMMSLGVQAQTSPQKEQARQEREQARKQRQAQAEKARQEREQARREELARRDAYLVELARVERERGLAETAGGDRIFFAADDAALSKEAELVLIRTIHWLRLHPASVLELQERCPEPATQARLALSKRRIQRVNDFLVDYSASAERVRRLAPVMAASSGGIVPAPGPCAVFLSATPER